jgi:hypothetical protein
LLGAPLSIRSAYLFVCRAYSTRLPTSSLVVLDCRTEFGRNQRGKASQSNVDDCMRPTSESLSVSSNNDRQSGGPPFRQSIFKSACLEAVLAQCGDGLKRKHAIWPTAVSNNLLFAVEF